MSNRYVCYGSLTAAECDAAGPVPEVAVIESRQLGGTHVHQGVLLVRLITTTSFGLKMQRPMVTLKLHRGPQGQDVRRSGIRERWAREKDTLKHGTVVWELKFSFSMDVDADEGRRGKDTRCLEVISKYNTLTTRAVKFASKLNYFIFAYFDPIIIYF